MFTMQLDVLITEIILSLQCFYFSYVASQVNAQNNLLKVWSTSFFIVLGIASFLGAIVNGLFYFDNSLLVDILWNLSLLFLGVGISIFWILGAAVINSTAFYRLMIYFSIICFAIYYLSLLLLSNEFLVAIFYSMVTILYMLFVFIFKFLLDLSNKLFSGIIGLGIFILATCIQQMEFELTNIGLSNNAIFHILVMISFTLFFITLKHLFTENNAIKEYWEKRMYN